MRDVRDFCPLTLGVIDREVQAYSYIKALRKAGTPVSIQVVLAAAEGIVMARDSTLLRSNGGSIELKRSWAVSLLSRMGYVKRRGSTSTKSNLSDQAIKHFKHSPCTYQKFTRSHLSYSTGIKQVRYPIGSNVKLGYGRAWGREGHYKK